MEPRTLSFNSEATEEDMASISSEQAALGDMTTAHRTHLNVFDPEVAKADLTKWLLGLYAASTQNNLHRVVAVDVSLRLVEDEGTSPSIPDSAPTDLPDITEQKSLLQLR